MNGQIKRGSHGQADRFVTAEERAARRQDSLGPYFRLQDSLCRNYLERAADPTEFEGLKTLFPFVREMSVLGVVRDRRNMGMWMQWAFLAGHDLGRAHPELLEAILPGQEIQRAMNRVAVVQRHAVSSRLRYWILLHACERIVEAQWSTVPADHLEPLLLEVVVRSLRAGFAAGTVLRSDPVLCDFISDMPERISDGIEDLAGRAVTAAPLHALGRPVAALLEHPLIRLARGLHPDVRTQQKTVLRFLVDRLRALGVKSENECPVSPQALVAWVAEALAYGRRVKTGQPGVLGKIAQERRRQRPQDLVDVAATILAEAGGPDPVRLLNPMKKSQEHICGRPPGQFYGDHLARVAYFSDFAIRISWLLPEAESG